MDEQRTHSQEAIEFGALVAAVSAHCEWCEARMVCPNGCDRATGDEHPSGLRDAIEHGREEWTRVSTTEGTRRYEMDFVEDAVVAWLSVVSEEEREAVNVAIYESKVASDYGISSRAVAELADAALAASRRVLVPRIESDENEGV